MRRKGVKVGRWDKGSKSGTVSPKLGRLTCRYDKYKSLVHQARSQTFRKGGVELACW